jgi:hypothetical protein
MRDLSNIIPEANRRTARELQTAGSILSQRREHPVIPQLAGQEVPVRRPQTIFIG